jgi:hypothetical protein
MAALIVSHWRVAILWFVSLIAVSAITSSAQSPRQGGQLGLPSGFMLENLVILSGNDRGFRLERIRDGVPIGSIVARVDDRWVAPQTC